MKNRKAQAAIEFLTTYGWALLIIALVLVALGWLGVFSVPDIINQFCQFPIQTFECNDVLLMSRQTPDQTTVQLKITNNFGRRVYLCPLIPANIPAYCSAKEPVPTTGIPSEVTAVPDACGDPSFSSPLRPIIEPGAQISTVSPCFDETGTMRFTPIRSKYTGKIYIFYSFEGEKSGKARIVVGNLVAQVQPSSGPPIVIT